MRITAAVAALLLLVSSAGAEEVEVPLPPLPKLELPPAEEGIVMDFSAYLRLVLKKHPELKAARAEARAKGETPQQAGSLPDPQLTLGVMDLPVDSYSFSKEDMTRKSIGLRQAFPAPGKRDLRQSVAERDAAAAAAMAQEKGLELIEKARVAFYRLRYLTAAREIAGKNKEILHTFIDAAMTKYTVGMGQQADVLKAQLEYSKMLEYIIRVDQELSTLRKTLNAWADLPEKTDWRRPSITPIDGVVGDEAELLEKGLKQRPLFRALQAKLERAARSLELAGRESLPDYAVSLTYSQRDDSPMQRSDLVSAEIMFDLPLWKSSKQDRMVAESVVMEDAARQDILAERLRLREDLYMLMDEQQKNQKLLVLFDSSLIMQAEQASESSMAAYRVNKVDFLTLVTNQLTWFDYQIQRAQVEYELMAGRARLLRALGEDAAEVEYGN